MSDSTPAFFGLPSSLNPFAPNPSAHDPGLLDNLRPLNWDAGRPAAPKPESTKPFILTPAHELLVRAQAAAGKPHNQIAYTIIGSKHELARAATLAITEFLAAPDVKIDGWWELVPGRKAGTVEVDIVRSLLLQDIHEKGGFGLLVTEGAAPMLVRVQSGIVEPAKRRDIKVYVQKQVEALPVRFNNIDRIDLLNLVLEKNRSLFDADMLEFLPAIEPNFIRDTRENAYFFMRNGWVEITATTSELRPYEELPGLIWKSQIRPHDYVQISQPQYEQCDIHAFLLNAFGHDPARVRAAQLALGHLLHLHKDDTNTKCIIFEDREAAPGESNGRTGKSLLLKAVSHLRNLAFIDGRLFDFGSPFKWQLVNRDTDVIVFDEWREKLSIAPLFNSITDSLAVNHKNQPEFVIPFSLSPKFAITTNSVITGDGDSFAGRKVKLALDKFYTPTKTPSIVHGRAFFGQDWDSDGGEWNRFINLAIGWVQLYLANGHKLESVQLAETTHREFLQDTHENFPRFFKDMQEAARKDVQECTAPDGQVCIWLDEAFRLFNGDLGPKEQVGKTSIAKYMRKANCETGRERRYGKHQGQTYFTWGEKRAE